MKNNEKERLELVEKQLLKILLKRFKIELETKKNNCSRIISTKFYVSPFDGAKEEGYSQINELINAGLFKSFASKYNLFVINSKEIKDEKNVYYEVVWNIENYLQNLNVIEEDKGITKSLCNYSYM